MKLKNKIIVVWSIFSLTTIAAAAIMYIGIALRCWFCNPGFNEVESFNRLGEMCWEMPLYMTSMIIAIIWVIWLLPKVIRILRKWAETA